MRNRIKVVLLRNEGRTVVRIAQALKTHEETVRQHLEDYSLEQKLKPENGGSSSKLSDAQAQELVAHLEAHTYVQAQDICAYVTTKYAISYTNSGMRRWLYDHDFSFKKPKETPAKADALQQKIWVERYRELVNQTPSNEPIVFVDSTHPTMATKVSYGWIRKGKNKPIASTASRTRMNITGALNLRAMHVLTDDFDTINGENTVAFLQKLRDAHPDAPKMHVILDQSSYHKSALVRKFAADNNIVLNYLPPYSPNLNVIERLWKVLNERVRNNRYFQSAKEFRSAIQAFFEGLAQSIPRHLASRFTDNFHVLHPAS